VPSDSGAGAFWETSVSWRRRVVVLVTLEQNPWVSRALLAPDGCLFRPLPNRRKTGIMNLEGTGAGGGGPPLPAELCSHVPFAPPTCVISARPIRADLLSRSWVACRHLGDRSFTCERQHLC
jgi:hypothetical protein